MSDVLWVKYFTRTCAIQWCRLALCWFITDLGESSSLSLSLPGFPSHSPALWSLVSWSSGQKCGISRCPFCCQFPAIGVTHWARRWRWGGGEVLKKWECSLPSLALSSPFSTLLDRKTGNPLLQLHCRSALCKTQTKKEVKEEREKSATPILSGPQGSPFLILWTER